MLSLEPELTQLRDEGLLAPAAAAQLAAIERRERFSIHGELRAASYLAVLMLITGVGIVLKNNLDRIGPLMIVAILLAAAAACYAWAIRKHLAGRTRTIVDEYVLLLAALLLSAAVGYAESRFHLLGANWQRHLLLLALIHGATAYWLESRFVLSAALTAFAAWLGVEHQGLISSGVETGARGLLFAMLVLGMRQLNRVSPRGRPSFDLVYANAAAIVGFFSALSWVAGDDMRWVGLLTVALLDAIFLTEGMRRRNELLVSYSLIASVIAIDIVTFDLDSTLGILVACLSAVGAIATLFAMHRNFRRDDVAPAPKAPA